MVVVSAWIGTLGHTLSTCRPFCIFLLLDRFFFFLPLGNTQLSKPGSATVSAALRDHWRGPCRREASCGQEDGITNLVGNFLNPDGSPGEPPGRRLRATTNHCTSAPLAQLRSHREGASGLGFEGEQRAISGAKTVGGGNDEVLSDLPSHVT